MSAPRGDCQNCGRRMQLRNDGTVWFHRGRWLPYAHTEDGQTTVYERMLATRAMRELDQGAAS